MSYSILFVDDEKYILEALKRSMKSSPYNCFFVENGKAALDILQNNNIDVVVTDAKMPEMDGFQLLDQIDNHNFNVVKIMLSAYVSAEQAMRKVQEGKIYKFIPKPWTVEALLTTIEEAIKQKNNA